MMRSAALAPVAPPKPSPRADDARRGEPARFLSNMHDTSRQLRLGTPWRYRPSTARRSALCARAADEAVGTSTVSAIRTLRKIYQRNGTLCHKRGRKPMRIDLLSAAIRREVSMHIHGAALFKLLFQYCAGADHDGAHILKPLH